MNRALCNKGVLVALKFAAFNASYICWSHYFVMYRVLVASMNNCGEHVTFELLSVEGKVFLILMDLYLDLISCCDPIGKFRGAQSMHYAGQWMFVEE